MAGCQELDVEEQRLLQWSIRIALFKELKELDLTEIVETMDNTNLQGELACAGGVCEI